MKSNPRLLCRIFVSLITFAISHAADGQEICKPVPPLASMPIPWQAGAPALNTDPNSPVWKQAASAWITKDCTRTVEYPKLKTEVRAFWTEQHVYFLFLCPYETLNLFLPADNSKARVGLWDRDVVEIFLGADLTDIGRYREFEVAPTGDWIDLDIRLDLKTHHSNGNSNWRSGWRTAARIDSKRHVWYAAAQIPLSAVSAETVKAGTRWRANLYRIEGQGSDSQRHFLCWQPTCAPGLDPNHVPENFGTMIFEKKGQAVAEIR